VNPIGKTVKKVMAANTWDKRVGEIRQIPEQHGKSEQPAVYAAVARQLYVPFLAPDFAYVHEAPFYEENFGTVYG
jgi:hypothetical protein